MILTQEGRQKAIYAIHAHMFSFGTGLALFQSAGCFFVSLPVVSLRSTTGYKLTSLQLVRPAPILSTENREEPMLLADNLYKTSIRFDGPPGREQHGFPPQE